MSVFSSMYRIEYDGIVYHGLEGEVKILYERFEYVLETKDGRILSEPIQLLSESKVCTLSRLYHLAAILQKLHPEIPWDWEAEFIQFENSAYQASISDWVYLIAHNRVRPIFSTDFAAEWFDQIVEKWFRDKGMLRDKDEIIETAKLKVQKLIYDRSKTDFIDLSSYHKFLEANRS